MLRARLLVLMLPQIASLACSRDPGTQPYEVDDSTPGAVATGETARLEFPVRSLARDRDFEGCGPSPVLPTLALDSATCAPDCVASVVEPRAVTVFSDRPGEKQVEVLGRTSDGNDFKRVVTLSFRDATRIEAVRDSSTSPSGTAYGMVPGDLQQWELSVADERGTLWATQCNINTIAAPGARVESGCTPGLASPAPRTVLVHALAPGAATITMRYGQLARTERVTVIDLASVRRVELRELLPPSAVALDVASVLAPRREPLIFRYQCDQLSNPVVPWLETSDGTIAFGAANRLRVEPEGALDFLPSAQVVSVGVRKLVDGTVVGDFGVSTALLVAAPYLVRPGCPGVDAEPRDGGTGDAADAQDAASDAPIDAETDAADGGDGP